jgi:UDP-glucuronate 4-epimerase
LKMPKKQILVTGGAGFIGSHLVDKLLAEDIWQVSALDNFSEFYSPAVKRANLAQHRNNPDFRLYEADICDAETLHEIFSKNRFDAIVHLAAWAGVRPSLLNPKLYAAVNVNGTLNLLEAAKQAGVRQFVFGSSSSVYGINSKIPFAEDDPVHQPISPYAATKAAGELLCHTFAHLYDMRAVCLRFFTVYGARQRPDLAIHKFSKLIWEGKPIPVFGDGTTRRDYTFIDDIIQGVRAAIDYDRTNFEIFNLGESETIELKDLISLLEENLGVEAVIDRQPMQPGDVPLTFADISKARELLDYDPQTKIEQGIPKFTEWFVKTQNQTACENGLSEKALR